ncbi:hypothetical protein KCP71_07770 [Salmonella enterica subsp. enterica]|nr:hypothetical protein KCP71_07770 [Salmonella enterica subsp. enterica]
MGCAGFQSFGLGPAVPKQLSLLQCCAARWRKSLFTVSARRQIRYPFCRDGQADPHSAVGLPRPLDIMREAALHRNFEPTIRGAKRQLELPGINVAGRAFVRLRSGWRPEAKAASDIDLLVTVAVKLDETTRRALLNDLMEFLASLGERDAPRYRKSPLSHDDIIPWRYPAKRELQFGEWQRNDIPCGYLRASHDRH